MHHSCELLVIPSQCKTLKNGQWCDMFDEFRRAKTEFSLHDIRSDRLQHCSDCTKQSQQQAEDGAIVTRTMCCQSNAKDDWNEREVCGFAVGRPCAQLEEDRDDDY